MPSNLAKRDLRKIEKRKVLVKRTNKFLSDNFKWFIVAVVLLILSLGYFRTLKPKYDQAREMFDITNQRMEDDYRSKKRELQKITDLLSAYSKVTPAYAEKIDSIAPSSIDQIFTEINRIFIDNELLIKSLNINEVDVRDPKAAKISKKKNYLASGEIGKLRISTTAMGTDYEAFKRLLYSIENHLRLIDIDNLSFNPGGQSTDLVMSAYFKK